MIKKLVPILGFLLITFVFFWQFFIKGLVPIPTDTIVGLYHPYRDFYTKDYPRGIPFKNFLITDPVRQQYPWKNFSIAEFKQGQIPTWNPYSFSGTPNLANFQSSVFYPLNTILFLFSFQYAWSFFVMLQPLLAGIFMYLYLRSLRLDAYSSFFGGIVFAFGGFFATWLEWGTVIHTGLWLPLILLSIDKILNYVDQDKLKFSIFNFKIPKYIAWTGAFIFSSVACVFGGHLQTLFYIFVFSIIYAILRIFQNKQKLKKAVILISSLFISFLITSVQLLPTLKFINLSGRGFDQLVWQKEGWFIPYKHLVQFMIPDFFGNPSTLNYWGTWNYGEMTSFLGVGSLILALVALFFVRRKIVLFYFITVFIVLVLVTPSFISKIPFILSIPFISTAQPTRLIYLLGFCVSALSAIGLNYVYLKGSFKRVIIPIVIIGTLFVLIFGFTFIGTNFGIEVINIKIAQRNIFFPGLIFVVSSVLILATTLVKKKFKPFFLVLIIIVLVFDLFRFSWKFNTFSDAKYLYPNTPSIGYIKKNIGEYRIATNDARILPPNFSIMHKIPSVEGYDPLYIERYAQFISAINRNEPDVSPPFGFNRIIRIENFSSNLIDLLSIKYVLSLSDLNINNFEKVFEEGETKIYENKNVLPKAFFVDSVIMTKGEQEAINAMFSKDFDPLKKAVIEEKIPVSNFSKGSVKVINYMPNKIELESKNKDVGFLVLTDSYYPSWTVFIDGKKEKIYRTNFNFRGIIVPEGNHLITFENNLL